MGLAGTQQLPTDWKKFIDTTFFAYLPKVKKMRTLFSETNVDPTQITNEYARMTQTYAEATGYSGFGTPITLAEGSRAVMDDFGTEDGTSSQVSKSLGFRVDRKLLSSGLPFQRDYVARHSVELMNSIENYVNGALATNMASNAGQSYSATGGTWATTGDPVQDINDAKNSFKKRSGGIDADFAAIHPDNFTDISNDFRFQNTFYSPAGSVLDKGVLTPKPLGLDWVVETAVTKGTFFMGKKGMFGRLLISENYKTYETTEGAAGNTYEAVFSYVDQYPLPYYLMYGTGI
ncbi:MAG: hypothetical protein M0R66_01280 [Candidatus Omnitrophica bacterium]|nr:hypothetical protein [Candidatus Omnitrophota bacterium]